MSFPFSMRLAINPAHISTEFKTAVSLVLAAVPF